MDDSELETLLGRVASGEVDPDEAARTTLTDLDAVADAEWFDRSRTLVLHGPGYERPAASGTVGVGQTAGIVNAVYQYRYGRTRSALTSRIGAPPRRSRNAGRPEDHQKQVRTTV